MTPDLTTHPTAPPRTDEPTATGGSVPYSEDQVRRDIASLLARASALAEQAGMRRLEAQIDTVCKPLLPRLVGGQEVA